MKHLAMQMMHMLLVNDAMMHLSRGPRMPTYRDRTINRTNLKCIGKGCMCGCRLPFFKLKMCK